MLAIRLQRVGRKGYPTYRLAVQESQRHPSSGRVVAYVGSYNPHTKEANLNTDKVEFYLKNGAQPTPRVVKILQEKKVALPEWVKFHVQKESKIRKAEKLRKNQPNEEAVVEAEDTPVETTTEETVAE
ncbi:MAG TPA: 30S ribosomal protein S16 [Candidatus Saccharibacteria bacterium]|nr:30S ribosomal protein S16 [Candidatus Saccharibacteria bacterium]